jgi:hypothetical protein
VAVAKVQGRAVLRRRGPGGKGEGVSVLDLEEIKNHRLADGRLAVISA